MSRESGEEEEDWIGTAHPSDPPGGKDSNARVIVHLDLDCFYAQVEAILDPTLKDVPFAVHQKQFVVTTNYAARAVGVPKTGASVAEVRQRFPSLRWVNGEDLREYRRFSRRVHETLLRGMPGCPVERLGMDENFVDVTALAQKRLGEGGGEASSADSSYFAGKIFGGSVLDPSDPAHCRLAVGSRIAEEARKLVLRETGLTSSAGVAGNKLLAKLVGKCHKPDGQTTLLPEDTGRIMSTLDGARSIPGVGSSTAALLSERGVETVADLQGATEAALRGPCLDASAARRLIDLSLGVDPTPVRQSGRPKTIGLEDRFRRLGGREECAEKVRWLVGRLAALVFEDGRMPRSLKVTVRDAAKEEGKGFHRESRQCKVSPALFSDLRTSDTLSERSLEEITAACMGLLEKAVDFTGRFHLTLLGVAVGDLLETAKGTRSIAAFFGGGGGGGGEKRTMEDHSGGEVGKRRKQTGSTGPECPEGWDREVFSSLPADIQRELLESRSDPPAPLHSSNKSEQKKRGPSILSYFSKSKK